MGLPGVERFPHLGRVFLSYLDIRSAHILRHPKHKKHILRNKEKELKQKEEEQNRRDIDLKVREEEQLTKELTKEFTDSSSISSDKSES